MLNVKLIASALVVAMLAGCATVSPMTTAAAGRNCSAESAAAGESLAYALVNNETVRNPTPVYDACNDAAIAASIAISQNAAANNATANVVAATIFGIAAAALVGATQPTYLYVPVRRCNFWRCW
jgi:hypothetical protein